MKQFRIGGVPEHFNLPWYLTLKNKAYHPYHINLRWQDYYGGTGEMCLALREKEIDMAVILTEGIVRDIIEGNECKIVQVFVESPLIWGIHVAKNTHYQSIADLQGTTAAISRFGSGSHLMTYVNAENQGWDTEKDLKFVEINDLKGALEGLPSGIGDYFMWEKFTTKPFVDNGPFRLVGECPTPWPCFVIAVRNEVLANEPEAIMNLLKVINQTTSAFKNIPSIDQQLADRYGQRLEDVQAWLSMTAWSQENLKLEVLEKVQTKLKQLELIAEKIPAKNILHFF
jgi:ABC-type nitrate/sulfonate/bicarbonate transport system substrate-binding protein